MYGYDGNMSAIDWLELIGTEGVSTLREADRDNLRASGILSPDDSIRQDQLDRALRDKSTEATSRAQ